MILTESEIKAYPVLEGYKTVRVKFKKIGRLQFVSHLDLQRSMQRIINRAGLPMWYTKGFNPHMKLNFAVPLPVGVESECELLDLRLCRDIPCEAVRDQLNAKLTDELYVLDVRVPETSFSDIAYADYRMKINTRGASEELVVKLGEALARKPIFVTKHSKSGDKEVDISKMFEVKGLALEDGVIVLDARLATGEGNTLNPQMLVNYMKESCCILSTDPTEENCDILRRRFLTASGEEFK